LDRPFIDLITPRLPPLRDGIGDYTMRLAESLRDAAAVRILTAHGINSDRGGIRIERAFSTSPITGVNALFSSVHARQPSWIILQYNPFSYGRWGLNPSLPQVIARIRRLGSTRIGLMV